VQLLNIEYLLTYLCSYKPISQINPKHALFVTTGMRYENNIQSGNSKYIKKLSA